MPKKTKSSAKRGAAATVKAKSGAKSKSQSNAKTNKSAFVRSLAATLSASEVIARGKTRGIRLSAAQVYTIRANARRKGPKSDGRAARAIATLAAKRGGRTKSGRGGDSREAEFIAAALDLGLAKAEGLISALRSKAVAAMS